jgi:hypothetical protein
MDTLAKLVRINCIVFELTYVFYTQVAEARRHQLYSLYVFILSS